MTEQSEGFFADLQASLDTYQRDQMPINQEFQRLVTEASTAYQQGELTQAEFFNILRSTNVPANIFLRFLGPGSELTLRRTRAGAITLEDNEGQITASLGLDENGEIAIENLKMVWLDDNFELHEYTPQYDIVRQGDELIIVDEEAELKKTLRNAVLSAQVPWETPE